MNLPQRKRLPHDIPLFVNVSNEVYFVTVCCVERGRNQLAIPSRAASLLQSIVHQNSRKVWHTHLFLIMPDHVHGLFSFGPNGRPLKETVRLWKHWTSVNLRIEWQRDFFEHRLRNEESRRDKADYILHNPVRAALVAQPDQWPYVWWPDGDGQMVSWPRPPAGQNRVCMC
jgi:putative transposase